MPHGFKRDVPMTKFLKKNRVLMENGSFVSLPNATGIHFHLEGTDRSRVRGIIWARCKARCQMPTHVADCPLYLSHDAWELDHIKGGLSDRCDCLHNLRAVSIPCHRAKHVRTRFGETNHDLTGILKASIREVRKRKAKEEFEAVQGETND